MHECGLHRLEDDTALAALSGCRECARQPARRRRVGGGVERRASCAGRGGKTSETPSLSGCGRWLRGGLRTQYTSSLAMSRGAIAAKSPSPFSRRTAGMQLRVPGLGSRHGHPGYGHQILRSHPAGEQPARRPAARYRVGLTASHRSPRRRSGRPECQRCPPVLEGPPRPASAFSAAERARYGEFSSRDSIGSHASSIHLGAGRAGTGSRRGTGDKTLRARRFH